MQFSVGHHQNITLLHPQDDDTRRLLEWCAPDAAVWFGDALVIERARLQTLLERLKEHQRQAPLPT